MTIEDHTAVHESDDHTGCPALCLLHRQLVYRSILAGDQLEWTLDDEGVLRSGEATAYVLNTGDIQIDFTDLDYSQRSLVIGAGVMLQTLEDLIFVVRGEVL